jgi:ribosome-binding protein aMBF1 (putative translation factor)
MKCAVCEGETIGLKKGIYNGKISLVCEVCAQEENIPLIKETSKEELNTINEPLSVRERLEKMHPGRSRISRDEAIAHKNLAKIKFPTPRQDHPDLVENYDWRIKTARRRKKLSTAQLSEITGVNQGKIELLEKAQIPSEFEQDIVKLADYLGIQLLTNPHNRIKFITPEAKIQEEEKILEEVREKMHERTEPPRASKIGFGKKHVAQEENEEINMSSEEKAKREQVIKKDKEWLKKVEKGEIDFSDKTQLENITLSDLAELKRKREHQDMFGDDDLVFDED